MKNSTQMQRFMSLLVIAALGVLLAVAAPAHAQGRPDCAEVLHAYHRASGHDGARVPDPDHLASKLGVEPDYVERCARAYGRSVKRRKTPAADEYVDADDLSAKREEEEYDEVAKEERDQQANAVQEDLRKGVYANPEPGRGVNPDSSAEWEPFLTHEWQPHVTHEWAPFIRDDDDPGFE